VNARSIAVIIGVGLVAGILTNILLGGGGLIRTIIVGIIGSFIGPAVMSWLKIDLGIRNTLVAQIVVATIGAVLLVLIARYVAR
jgi:uncharacterized membrane protein YeaQ/YmgE (transglycosylase-associated protein family)